MASSGRRRTPPHKKAGFYQGDVWARSADPSENGAVANNMRFMDTSTFIGCLDCLSWNRAPNRRLK
jgi:hypothetical protein